MGRVWPGAIVEENTLQFHISTIRKALGRDRGILKTVSGRGYRLLGDWAIRRDSAAAGPVAFEPMRLQVELPLTNLPSAEFNLIGRAAALQSLLNLVSANRLVTLTGPGGIGKTALALEVARRLFHNFDGDGGLAELASLSDPGLVPTAVAGALGLAVGSGEISAEAVARAIGTRKLLLVIDNCEHVIDAAADLAEAVARTCPRTTVLVTSREILRIQGEHVYRVLPLDVPPEHPREPDDIREYGAVQLLLARIMASNSGFTANIENLVAAGAICRRLDGIPLAIEFAAARVATLGLQQVAARLDDRFALLTAGRRTALPRHRTLRATLDWSYTLLPRPEQRLLGRLAVFPAGFTLEAATAVMSDVEGAPPTILDGIANLVAKSLVALDGSAQGGRWRLLETIRAYALDRLAASGEATRAMRRHAEFFRDLVAPAAPGPPVRPTIEDTTRNGREIDNVRAALDWAFSPDGDTRIGVVLTAAYTPVWLHLSLTSECRERAERALDGLEPSIELSAPLEAQLLRALGFALIYTMGPVERTGMLLARALAISENLDDVEAQLQTLWALWVLHRETGEYHADQSTTEQFARLARRGGDPATILVADRLMGATQHYAGRQHDAEQHLERVIRLYVEPKDQRHTLWFRFNQRLLARALLARVLWLRGLVDQAVAHAQVSHEEGQVTDHRLSFLWVHQQAVCLIAMLTGDTAAAQRSVQLIIDIATSQNATYWMNVARCLDGKLLIARGAFEAGSAMLRTALDESERTGWRMPRLEFLTAHAEGLAGLGQRTEALVTIERALAMANRGGERWYAPEVLRVKGELLIADGGERSAAMAEDCFRDALELAREQTALSWELRTATSLARLRIGQDRLDDAREILAPVYGRFTEGFKTADLRAASAMLDSLSLRRPGVRG